jgi:SAM-dependent methyltransferase
MTPWDGGEYQARFDALAASGADVHGEAMFVRRFAPVSVLDAGCGTGRVAIELARHGIEVIGVDVDASMLETARQLAPDVEWIEADLAALALHRTFDVVVLAGNVLLFTPPGTEPAVVAGCARHACGRGRLPARPELRPRPVRRRLRGGRSRARRTVRHLGWCAVRRRWVCRVGASTAAHMTDTARHAKRGFIDWFLRDRETGKIVIAQWPNVPLLVFLVATAVRLVFSPSGALGTVVSVVGTVALALWAGDEIVRGVNPFRRILGGVVLAALVVGLLSSR